MTTIKEIASLTHVSAATVSNVLNGKGGASEAKMLEIKAMAEKLHYTPNALAKNLKNRSTKTIGIITEDLTVFNTPEIVDGIDACCEKNGYDIILGNMRLYKRYDNDFTDTEKHQELIDAMVEAMLSKQVEGMVYVGYHCREITYLPSKIFVPLSYAYCYAEKTYPSVIFDDEKAAYDVTTMLLSKGHRRIGIICGPITSFHTQERLRGYQRALFDANILYDIRLVMPGDWKRDAGFEAAKKLIPMEVTAIFSFNDIMASGVFEYCRKSGIQIGTDLSLVGFDNREISVGYTPELTTVSPPLYEIGVKAAQLVLDELNLKRPERQLYMMPCKVIQRQSVVER